MVLQFRNFIQIKTLVLFLTTLHVHPEYNRKNKISEEKNSQDTVVKTVVKTGNTVVKTVVETSQTSDNKIIELINRTIKSTEMSLLKRQV